MNDFRATADATPWHRQPWPWLLMAGPAIVIVAGVFTVGLAILSEDGLVADDYYKRGLEINRTLTRSEHAAAMGMVAAVDVASNGVAKVALHSASAEMPGEPSTLRLLLVHPTRAESDIAATLRRASPQHYVGTITAPAPGRWRVIVESEHWRLASGRVQAPIVDLVLRAGEPADARQGNAGQGPGSAD